LDFFHHERVVCALVRTTSPFFGRGPPTASEGKGDARLDPACGNETLRSAVHQGMNDLVYAGVVFLFFIVSALYVRFCDKL
jgi:hypothetical protein